MHCCLQVIERIVGEDKLPWEGEARAKELLKRAGRFKDAVLGLLCRDAAQRVSVQTFVQQYASILSTTTQQAGAGPPVSVEGDQNLNLDLNLDGGDFPASVDAEGRPQKCVWMESM